MTTYYIEYETPPLRAIYWCECDAETEQRAREQFRIEKPISRIRKIQTEPPAFLKQSK